MRLLALLSLPLLLLAACGGGGGVEPTPPRLPEDLPQDIPIYDNAVITAASRVGAAQGDIYVIGLETADAAEAVRSFYEERLAEPPWEVTNVVEIPEQSTVIVEFARRGSGEAGTVAVQEEQTNGHKTIVAISLSASAPAATPTPSPEP
jgi:hypothetical protein